MEKIAKIYENNAWIMDFSFFWGVLFAFIPSATLKILHALALKVEVREQDNLLLFELTQVFRYNHVRVRIWIFQQNYISVTSKPRCYCGIQARTSEGFPV